MVWHHRANSWLAYFWWVLTFLQNKLQDIKRTNSAPFSISRYFGFRFCLYEKKNYYRSYERMEELREAVEEALMGINRHFFKKLHSTFSLTIICNYVVLNMNKYFITFRYKNKISINSSVLFCKNYDQYILFSHG